MPVMPAKINYESLALFGKFGGAMLGLLLIVWLIALLTPKAAKLIDKLFHRKSGGKPDPESGEPPRVVSPPKENAAERDFGKPPQGGGKEKYSEETYKVYSIFEDRPNGAVNGAVKNKDEENNKNG